MAGGKPGGADRAERAVFQLGLQGGAVVGVERVFADPAALCLVEGLQPAGKFAHRAAGGEDDEVEDMDADIAENAL